MFDDSILGDFNPTSKDGKAIVPILVSLFQNFQDNFLAVFEKKFDDFKADVLKSSMEKDAKIERMENEMASLKHDLRKLEDKIEDNDSYERRDTVILSGHKLPNQTPNENTQNLVCSLIKDNLDVKINAEDISTAHRLGNRNDKKSIIVKFCRRDIKNDLFTASRRSKPDQFFINECLTPQRQTISYVLRRAKREFPTIVSGSATFDGKVYAWVKPPNPNAPGAKDLRHAVNNHSRLLDFCNRTLNVPLSHFIKEWTH